MSVRVRTTSRGIEVDIRLRMPDGTIRRERRAAPVQDESKAWAWAKRRENFLITGIDSTRGLNVVDRPGYVYFLRDASGAVKVGWASNVQARISALHTASAGPLELLATIPGTLRTEHDIHKRFAHPRVHREWFVPDAAMLAFIFEREPAGSKGFSTPH